MLGCRQRVTRRSAGPSGIEPEAKTKSRGVMVRPCTCVASVANAADATTPRPKNQPDDAPGLYRLRSLPGVLGTFDTSVNWHPFLCQPLCRQVMDHDQGGGESSAGLARRPEATDHFLHTMCKEVKAT